MMRYRTTHIQHTLLLSSKSNNNRLIAEKEQHKMSFYAKNCVHRLPRIRILYVLYALILIYWCNIVGQNPKKVQFKDAALFISKAKINVFWNFLERSGHPKRPKWRKNFHKHWFQSLRLIANNHILTKQKHFILAWLNFWLIHNYYLDSRGWWRIEITFSCST